MPGLACPRCHPCGARALQLVLLCATCPLQSQKVMFRLRQSYLEVHSWHVPALNQSSCFASGSFYLSSV